MKKLQVVFLILMGLALLGMSMPSPSQAIIMVTTRAGIMQTDYTDWGQFGPQFTTVPSGSVATSNGGGVLTTVSTSGMADMYIYIQSSGWAGNFSPGDNLLWTGSNDDSLILQFSKGLAGVGAQVQRDYYYGFTGTIQAYGSTNNLLGTFTEAGYSDGAADNSAIFLGVRDSTADIFKIVYTVSGTSGLGFAINQLAMSNIPVPLPPSVLLLGSGLLGLLGLRRFRKH
jgi:hypothetical protein